MFKELREDYLVTRSELSTLTGRSINYLLKAEQATFPTPPTALVNFWTKVLTSHYIDVPNGRHSPYFDNLTLSKELDNYLGRRNLPPGVYARRNPELIKEILVAGYYDYQRTQRKKWLNDWVPRPIDTAHFSFCRKWISPLALAGYTIINENLQDLDSFYESNQLVSPTEYATSKGLCLPASVLFRVEKDGYVSNILIDVMYGLLKYCKSGEFVSATDYDLEYAYNLTNWISRVYEELKAQQLAYKAMKSLKVGSNG